MQTPEGAQATSLTPRLLRGLRADYAPAPDYPGYDVARVVPMGRNVLVRTDTCSEATAGGVYITEEQREKMDLAAETGVIYAIGFMAWKGWPPEAVPKVGARIVFERYAGQTTAGRDALGYRLMDFTNIAGWYLLDDDPDHPLPTPGQE